MISYAIGYGGGATNFFLWYDIPIPPIGNIFVSAIAAIVGYTIARHRLMDISVVVEKGLIYAISSDANRIEKLCQEVMDVVHPGR